MASVELLQTPTEAQIDRLFHALSDGTRRDILHRCVTEEPSVSQLALAYPMSVTAIQKHVRVLEEAGLVVRTRTGREQRVSTQHMAINQARIALDKLERDWRGRTERMAALLDELTATPDDGVATKGNDIGSYER